MLRLPSLILVVMERKEFLVLGESFWAQSRTKIRQWQARTGLLKLPIDTDFGLVSFESEMPSQSEDRERSTRLLTTARRR